MGEGTTIYCGDNCNHTGPHRYAPTNATTAAAWSRPMNADAVAALLNEGVEAFRLTREYVGEDLLPAQPGWSWFDWCEKVAALAAAPLPSEPPDPHWDLALGTRAEQEAAPLPSEPRGECWFCKGQFIEDALIAGYDTFDEQRLACLACNELMQGNWRTPLDIGYDTKQGPVLRDPGPKGGWPR